MKKIKYCHALLILLLGLFIFGCSKSNNNQGPNPTSKDAFYYINIYNFDQLYLSKTNSLDDLITLEKKDYYFYIENTDLPSNFLLTDRKTFILIDGYVSSSPVYYNGWHSSSFLNGEKSFVYFVNDLGYQNICINYANQQENLVPLDNLHYVSLVPSTIDKYYYSYNFDNKPLKTNDLIFSQKDNQYFNGELHEFNSYQEIDYHPTDENVSRVFCKALESWEECYYYVWNSDGELAKWPGSPMNKISEFLYYIDVDKAYDNIIFNAGPNHGEQTANLKISSAVNYELPLYDLANKCFVDFSLKSPSNTLIDVYYQAPSFIDNPYVYYLNQQIAMDYLSNGVYHANIPNNIYEVAFGSANIKTNYVIVNQAKPLFNGYSFADYNNGNDDIEHPDPFTQDDIKYYYDLFNPNNKVEISIHISNEELMKLENDYQKFSSMGSKSPIYRMCDLTIKINDDSYFLDGVGIRMKGNTSRTSFYNNEGIYNLIHYKLSFDETFDDVDEYEEPYVWESNELRKQRKKRTFGLMKSIELKWNKNFDGSHIKNIYASSLFSEFGIYSQKATLSKVQITNLGKLENLGLFDLMEPVDNNFLEKRLPASDLGGDLYKVGWDKTNGGSLTPDTIYGIGIEDELNNHFVIYDLKTNKKTSNHDHLTNLINGLSNNQSIEELVDIDYFLKFAAISYLTGNPDDYRNNYNNYFIYFLKSNSKAIFIPYDLDRTFGITKDYNPSGDAMTSVNPYTANSISGNQKNPLILKTVCEGANSSYLAAYTNYLKQITSSEYFQNSAFNDIYNNYKSLYENDYLPTIDKVKDKSIAFTLNDSNMSFSEYIEKIKKIINNL